IQPSADWRVEIETALTNARVVVLIVSRNFLESSFIQEDELPRILERRRKNKAKIFWLPIDNADELAQPEGWKKLGLDRIQAAWPPNNPLQEIRDTESCEMLDAARPSIHAQIRRELDPLGWRLRKVVNEKYAVVRRLGEGASRTLFLAWDNVMKRWVAIT